MGVEVEALTNGREERTHCQHLVFRGFGLHPVKHLEGDLGDMLSVRHPDLVGVVFHRSVPLR